jgi:hypothetical protein
MLYFFVIFNIKNFYKYKTEIEFLLIVKLKLSRTIKLRKYKIFKKQSWGLINTYRCRRKRFTLRFNLIAGIYNFELGL